MSQPSSAVIRSRQAAAGRDVVAHTPSGQKLAEAIQIANVLSKAGASGAIPKAYQNDPGGILAMVLWSERAGLDPITAMWGVHRIPGKNGELVPFVSAALRNDLANDKGFEFRVLETTAEVCRIQVYDHRSGYEVAKGSEVVVHISDIPADKFNVNPDGTPKMKTSSNGSKYSAKPGAWDQRPARMLHRQAQRDADAFHVQTFAASSFDLATEEEDGFASDWDFTEDDDEAFEPVVQAADGDLDVPDDMETALADVAAVKALLAVVRGMTDGQRAQFQAKAAQVAQSGAGSWSFADGHAWTMAELADASAWVDAALDAEEAATEPIEVEAEPSGNNGEPIGRPDPENEQDAGAVEPNLERVTTIRSTLKAHRVAVRVLLDAMHEANPETKVITKIPQFATEPELTEWALEWIPEEAARRKAAKDAEQ